MKIASRLGLELQRVLIETYWNVNLDDKLNQAVIDFSLNRNILECKFGGSRANYGWVVVLIETYWNVNAF